MVAMRRSVIVGMLVTAVAMTSLAGGAVGAAAAPDTAMARTGPQVDIPIRMTNAPMSKGQNGLVKIRLGNAAPFWVMLDTGSVGLRVFPGGWSGKVESGFGTAPFSLNGVKTTTDIKFQVAPTTNPYIEEWRRQGVYGILGVGVGRSPLPNPLALMRGNLGKRWSIHFVRTPEANSQRVGSLTLGAIIPASAQATFPLQTQGRASSGIKLWADHKAQACWTIGRTPVTCVDTWFDSGFHLTRVKGKAFASVVTEKAGVVRKGTLTRMSAPGAAFAVWEFRAGTTPSRDVVEIFSNKGSPSINTGNVPYFDYTVGYDIDRGLISLSTERQASS